MAGLSEAGALVFCSRSLRGRPPVADRSEVGDPLVTAISASNSPRSLTSATEIEFGLTELDYSNGILSCSLHRARRVFVVSLPVLESQEPASQRPATKLQIDQKKTSRPFFRAPRGSMLDLEDRKWIG